MRRLVQRRVIRDTVAIILRFAVVPRFGRPGLMFLQENNRAPLKAVRDRRVRRLTTGSRGTA
jgi:hypothetical protein